MDKDFNHTSEKGNNSTGDPEAVEKGRIRIGLWAAGIFTIIGFAFLAFAIINLFVIQKGKGDFSDYSLTPVALIMFLASLASFLLIRRGRLILGLWLVYATVLLPPVAGVLILSNIFILSLAYLAVFAPISIFLVFPRTSRKAATIATALAIAAIVIVDLLKPGYRLTSSALASFGPYAIALGGLALLAFSIRQAILGNILTKLIVAFVLIAAISVTSVVFFVDRSSRTSLTNTIGINLSGVANSEAIQIGQTLDSEMDKLKGLALTKAVQDRAASGTRDNAITTDQINALDMQWVNADKANNNADPLVAKVLSDKLSSELLKYQAEFPENVEVFLTDLKGVSLATTDRTSDYLQSDEDWWQKAYLNGQYIGLPQFEASSRTLAIVMATVVRVPGTNTITGVLRTTVNVNSFATILQAGVVGRTGQSIVYLPDNRMVRALPGTGSNSGLTVENSNLDLKSFSGSKGSYTSIMLDKNPSLLGIAGVSVADNDAGGKLINSLGWVVGTHQDQAEALLPVTQQTQNNLVLGIIIALLAALVAVFLARLLAGPIVRLNAAAQKVAAGDLTIQAKVEAHDETGTLAATFNKMVSQLSSLVGTLEQRVSDRTRALATSSEVSRRLSTILNRKELVVEVVNQVRNSFGYYHTQIYFYDDARENLVMAGGTGDAGETLLMRSHKVPRGLGLVGRAADTNQAVLVSDTSQNTEWLPNPLLPDTRSEVAIPISIGDEVLGVLDVQQNITNGLQKEDVDSLQSIANQVAVALQNIRSTENVVKRATELQTVATISTSAATTPDIQKMLETVVHLTQRGFGLYHAHIFVLDEHKQKLEIVACGWKAGDIHEGTHSTTVISMDQEQSLVARAARTRQAVIVNNVHIEPGWLPNPMLPDTASELAVPMVVGNEVLGVLDVQSDLLNAFTEEDASIQTTLATQVGTALQNARSFLAARGHAERETTLNLITQRIQSATSIESALQIAVRELGHALGGKPTQVALGQTAPTGEARADDM